MQALDTFLPRFDVNEVHSMSLACDAERALELALAAPAAPGRLVAALLRARGLPSTTSVAELFDRMGFDTLSASPTEVVIGASGTPWRPSGTIGPFADPRPGTVRIATDLRATAVPGGCILSTETRVLAADDAARRAFGRYWLVVGPFSALIRRRWLRAARDATTRGACGETGARS
jgi:hypothetical protein